MQAGKTVSISCHYMLITLFNDVLMNPQQSSSGSRVSMMRTIHLAWLQLEACLALWKGNEPSPSMRRGGENLWSETNSFVGGHKFWPSSSSVVCLCAKSPDAIWFHSTSLLAHRWLTCSQHRPEVRKSPAHQPWFSLSLLDTWPSEDCLCFAKRVGTPVRGVA